MIRVHYPSTVMTPLLLLVPGYKKPKAQAAGIASNSVGLLLCPLKKVCPFSGPGSLALQKLEFQGQKAQSPPVGHWK